jgi:hypothetical protein
MHSSVAAGLFVILAWAPVETWCQTMFTTFGPAETFNASLPGGSVGAGVLGGFPVADGGITLAYAFTPSVSAQLSRVDLGMEYVYSAENSPGPANLAVAIAADRAGVPGTAIETIQITGVLGSIASAPGLFRRIRYCGLSCRPAPGTGLCLRHPIYGTQPFFGSLARGRT